MFYKHSKLRGRSDSRAVHPESALFWSVTSVGDRINQFKKKLNSIEGDVLF